MQMQGGFNANQFEPSQSGGHPPAQKVPFTVTSCAIKENSSKDGGYFEVEFTSPIGSVIHRYNIWNKTPKAVEIAHGQLSALCRAVNRFQIDWGNEGAALKGAQGLMDVGYQKGEEPSEANPNAKGYTELKKVYDMAGNEPGKTGVPQPQTTPQGQQAAPLTQQPGGSWGQQPQTQQAPQQAPQGQQGGGQAWQPGNGGQAAATPPWGPR